MTWDTGILGENGRCLAQNVGAGQSGHIHDTSN